jgi:CheY-like chemotaxis protein
MSGFEASAAIRKAETNQLGAHVPICAMVSGDDEQEREKCRDAGMDEVISKPLDHKELIDLVEKWEYSAASKKNTSQSQNDPVGRYDAIFPPIKAHGV